MSQGLKHGNMYMNIYHVHIQCTCMCTYPCTCCTSTVHVFISFSACGPCIVACHLHSFDCTDISVRDFTTSKLCKFVVECHWIEVLEYVLIYHTHYEI